MADQNLKIRITAIDRTQRAFAAVSRGLSTVKNQIFSVQSAITALVAGAGIQRFAQEIDELAKTSRRLGLTVNELQSLQFAAEQTGVSAESLRTSLDRFNRNISETAIGTGIAKRSFEDLGVSVKDSEGVLRNTDDILTDVADALKGVESPADRTRIAMDLFGRSGAALVNTLAEGKGGINELRREFNDLTLQLDQQTAAAVEAANDRFNRLSKSIGSVLVQFGAKTFEGLSKFAEMTTIESLKAAASAFEAIGQSGTAEKLNDLVLGLQHAAIAAADAENAQTGNNDAVSDGALRINIYRKELEKLSQAQQQQFKAVTLAKNGLVDYARAAKDVRENMRSAALDGVQRLADTLTDVAMRTVTVKDAFRSMASSVLRDLVRIGIQQQITGPLASALFGGLQQSPVQATVPRIGGAGIPAPAGSAVPVGDVGGSGVTVVQNISLSTGVQQTVRAEVMNMMPQIGNAAKSAVLDARRRGGNFAAAF